MTQDRVRAMINELLTAAGWKPFDNMGFARKAYATAVGEKVASIYLGFWRDGEGFTVRGDYYSEGRNILEPWSVLVSLPNTDAEIRRLVRTFLADADRVVTNSYAARLLNPTQQRENHASH